MRILGHNLLPFSVLNLSTGWAAAASTGIVANVFFFDTDLAQEGDLSQYVTDMRNLYGSAVAATKIVLRPTPEGLLPINELQEGWKARSGHVYEIKNGCTIHYPAQAIPVGYPDQTQIQTAYASSVAAGNKALWGIGPAGYRAWDFAGVPHDALMPGIHLSTTDLTFDTAVSIDAVLSDVSDMSSAAAGTIAPISDTGVVGTAVNWTLAAGQEGNKLATATSSSKRFRFYQSSGTRRVIPVSTADVSQNASYKSVKWAIVLIQDSNYGALTNGNLIPTYFACPVGTVNSGELIELLSTTLGPGEFASVAQLRLSTEV